MTTEAEPAGREKRRRGFWIFLRDVLVIVVIAALVSFLVKTFVVRTFYIPSASMERTLMVNDRILVDELTPRWNDYERGDIVVFADPGGWLPVQPRQEPAPVVMQWVDGLLNLVGLASSDSEDHLVKRLIGLPGDHVVCCNSLGQIEINGAPIDELSYLNLPEGDTIASNEPFDVTVPEGAIWVLGDNRDRSQDARAHQNLPSGGFVPLDNVVGRAFLITWPFDRFGVIDSQHDIFNGVPDPQG